jgi:hypothetical protein
MKPLSTAPASAHKLHRPASQFHKKPETQSAPAQAVQIASIGKSTETTLAMGSKNR